MNKSSPPTLPVSSHQAMRQIMRRLSRVADSSRGYVLLRPGGCRGGRRTEAEGVPEGHLPVYVGEGMKRYVVSAEMLHHPLFVGLLDRSAQEYGYEQPGALRIPCSVLAFDRLLRALHDPALLADDHHLLLRLFSSSGDDDDDELVLHSSSSSS